MPGFTCNACNAEFEDAAAQKLHYKSEWHRYNLRRKVAGVPGVTEALFLARQKALAEEQKKLEKNRLVYSCTVCNKQYRSDKAYGEHIKSKAHLLNASGLSDSQNAGLPVIKGVPERPSTQLVNKKAWELDEPEHDDSDESEWEEADADDVALTAEALKNLDVRESGLRDQSSRNMELVEEIDWDVCRCFICDVCPDGTIESCVEHMHKMHGFFIPDGEYLKDPKGLLTYLGIKVTKDFACLYCNNNRKPFQSLEAVRNHMVSKNHCKLKYGDGDEEEDSDLDEFYDYLSSYIDENGMKIVPNEDNLECNYELGFGGAELVIRSKTDGRDSSKILGSREFLRYYRQRPRPSVERNDALSRALVSRYQNMGVATVQSKEKMMRMKTLRKIRHSGIEAFRTKVGIKNNVIRNLPKNVTF